MSDDIRNLLAGYATGTLTESERKTLFEAALADEELFAAISDEQPLRELLNDPVLRAELLGSILPAAPPPFRERFAAWLRRPGVAAAFVTAAMAVVVISVLPLLRDQTAVRPATVAQSNLPSPPAQMIRTPEPAAEAANTETETPRRRAERPAVVVHPPAVAPRTIKIPPARALEARPDGPAMAELPRPYAAPPAPPPSPQMAVLPAESSGARADSLPLAVASRASTQGSTSPRFIVLRKISSGEFAAVDPAETAFAAGDTVRIRVEPAESGLVSISGATPQPIMQSLTMGRPFETGDILLGAEDMRLIINFSSGFPVVRTLGSSLRTAEASRSKAGQPVEIILRVKKP